MPDRSVLKCNRQSVDSAGYGIPNALRTSTELFAADPVSDTCHGAPGTIREGGLEAGLMLFVASPITAME